MIDLVQRFADAERRPVSAGEETFAIRDATIGGETKPAIYAHPPSRLTWKVMVPDDGWLRTAIGIDQQAWDKDGDGVLFRVGVNDGHGGYKELLFQNVDPHSEPDHRRWLPITIDLDRFGGQRLDLIFNTNTSMPGKGDDGRNDFAYWGAPAICPRPYNVNAPQ